AANPIWAPKALGRPRLAGAPIVGRTVTCVVRWLVRPTRQLAYSFVADGLQVQSGARRTYRVRAADLGKRLACDAQGATAGGRGGTASLSSPRLVRSG
ncbi:MAG TPA: hypothetical protein VFB52_06640, partial [Solirubrobacterales bacterium]|nr:hypothetical protein [Solirubrobacterales bacterium]